MATPSLYDVLLESLNITHNIYLENGRKLAAKGHLELAAKEFRRANLLKDIGEDENVVEMLAGRVHQFQGGQSK